MANERMPADLFGERGSAAIVLEGPTDFRGWREAARQLIRDGVPPHDVNWSVNGEQASLLDGSSHSTRSASTAQENAASSSFTVPREFLKLAATVALHCDPTRFALLYRMLWRLREEHRLLSLSMDPDVVKALAKMHAFVRFREVPLTDPKAYMAWFEPSHFIVEAATPFFARRFANFPWAILTPQRSAYWDLESLTFPTCPRSIGGTYRKANSFLSSSAKRRSGRET
jgi:uracil-DNA glycosylase